MFTVNIYWEGDVTPRDKVDDARWTTPFSQGGTGPELPFSPDRSNHRSPARAVETLWATVRLQRAGSYASRLRLIVDARRQLAEDEVLAQVALDRMRTLVSLRARFGRRRQDDAWLHPAAVLRIVRKVAAEPACAHTVKDIAAEAGLGVSACIRALRGAVGLSPGALVCVIRAVAAAEALRDVALPQRSVALDTGYSSASHLNVAIRRYFGRSPGALRVLLTTNPGGLAPLSIAHMAFGAESEAAPRNPPLKSGGRSWAPVENSPVNLA